MKQSIIKLTLVTILTSALVSNAVVNAESSFIFYGDRIAQAVPSDSGAFFYSYLKNTGDETDTYSIIKTDSIPTGWFSVFCIDSLCLLDSATISLEPGDSSSVRPEIFPLQIGGDSKSTMRITSHNNPTDVKEMTFRVVSGFDLLLINVGANENQYRTFYDDALSMAAISYNFWDKNFTTFQLIDLINFHIILIYSGDKNNDILTADEITSIQNFLDLGNNAMFTGQRLASSLTQSGILEPYFGIEYTDIYSGSLMIEGVPDDIIGDGLGFNIFGGDGADNQTDPDIIIPIISNAVFEFTNGGIAGTRYSGNGFNTVFYSFGLEAVDNTIDRSEIVARTLEWFSSVTLIDDDPITLPDRTTLLKNYPNPFNADTKIVVVDPSGSTAWDNAIEIFDIKGRLVNSLSLSGANEIVWDGRDRFGNTSVSGVYFYRLKSPDNISRFSKMTLIK